MRFAAALFASTFCAIALSCATGEENDAAPLAGMGGRGSDAQAQEGGSGTENGGSESGGTSSGGSSGGGAGGVFGTDGVGGILGGSGTAGAGGEVSAGGAAGTGGTSGANGASGTAGTGGTAGRGGSAGASGTNGASGTGGRGGTSGASGTAGASGASGTAGRDGGSSCPSGQKTCGGVCVPITFANGCGPTDNQCDDCGNPPANSNGICTSGRCDFTCNSGFQKTATGCQSTTGSGGTGGSGGGSCNPSNCTNNCSIAAPFRCCRSNGQCGCSWVAAVYCN
jgi:hypothetical protein